MKTPARSLLSAILLAGAFFTNPSHSATHSTQHQAYTAAQGCENQNTYTEFESYSYLGYSASKGMYRYETVCIVPNQPWYDKDVDHYFQNESQNFNSQGEPDYQEPDISQCTQTSVEYTAGESIPSSVSTSDGCIYETDLSQPILSCHSYPESNQPETVYCEVATTGATGTFDPNESAPQDTTQEPQNEGTPVSTDPTTQAQQQTQDTLSNILGIEPIETYDYTNGTRQTTWANTDGCQVTANINPNGEFNISDDECDLYSSYVQQQNLENVSPDPDSAGDQTGGNDSPGNTGGNSDGSPSSPSLDGGNSSDAGGSSSGQNSDGSTADGQTAPPTVEQEPAPDAQESCDPSLEDCTGKTVKLLQDIENILDGDDNGFLGDSSSTIDTEQQNSLNNLDEIANGDFGFNNFNIDEMFRNLFNFPAATGCTGTFDKTIFGYRFFIDPCVSFKPLRDVLAWVFFVFGSIYVYNVFFGRRLIGGA